MKFQQQHDEKAAKAVRLATSISEFGPSKAIQNAPDTDINELMKRMSVSDGSVLPTQLGQIDMAYYGDFTEDPEDLRTVLDTHRNAQDMFRKLPATIRSRFGNDPLNMLTWVQNKENADEAVKLGLLTRKPQTPKIQPIEVIITNPPEKKDGNNTQNTGPLPGK